MAETDGQEAVMPGVEEGSTPPEPTPEPQAPDYSSLKVEAEGLPPGMTVDGLIKSYGEARGTLNTTQQEYADYQKQYEWAKDFETSLQQDPELEKHIRSYYDDKSPPQGVDTAINPLAQKVAALETHIQSAEMKKELDTLGDKYPDVITDEIKASVFAEAARTNNGDVAGIAWRLAGPTIAAKAAESATTQTAEQIQANNASYPQNRGTSAAPVPVSTATMPAGPEREAAILADIAAEFSRTE